MYSEERRQKLSTKQDGPSFQGTEAVFAPKGPDERGLAYSEKNQLPDLTMLTAYVL